MSAALVVVPDPASLDRPRTEDDLVAAFLLAYGETTRACYARDIREWRSWLARLGVDLLAAHRAHVDAWLRWMEQHAGLSPATINRRLSSISGLYSYAEDEEMVAKNPVRRVRRPRVPDESPRLGVDRDELRRLIDAAAEDGPRSHALVLVLGLLGTRITETLGIDVEDLGAERGHRVVELRRKGGKAQRVPLAAPVVEALDRLVAGRDRGPVFVTSTGRRWDRHAAAKVLRRLARTAGVEHRISPHSLRHGFATLALDAGAAIRDVQAAMGHSDPRVTMRYDRARGAHDRHPTYMLAAEVAS